MRDYLAIIKRNVFAPVVIAIYLLAISLLAVRQYRDAWFVSFVITINIIIGVVQEIRAKIALKKLELMSAPQARLIENGEEKLVPYESLKKGDEIRLLPGDELPADGKIIVSHGLEVNESMLTGESASVEKASSDQVFAATTVLAGEATVKVTAVGDESKAGEISKTLKRYKPELTPLQRVLQRAITWLTYGALVVALAIFVNYYFLGLDAVQILRTITAAAVTVVPEGLLLASSLLLAFGSLKLAQAKVLPQKLSAIEAMALLNLLAVDKTGTLTSDEVSFEGVEMFGDLDKSEIEELVALVAHETSGGNPTGLAILKKLHQLKKSSVKEILAFSSERKLAGVRAVVGGKSRTLIMGAPEFVAKLAPVNQAWQKKIDNWASQGQRVLLLAEFDDQKTSLKKLTKKGRAIAAVRLSNSLRDGVPDTIKFLQGRGVSVRVISGDNPKTVEYIAAQAGIKNADKSITGAELLKMNDDQFAEAANENTIFARVLPEQKERLIDYFKSQGMFTGMVGDGVNDALALKKADLGVAMYAGAPASRRVADLILMNNSFTSLPLGMRLGNRIMQAIEVIATLFFHKIIFGLVLLFATMALQMVYPFAPRHNTFMNIFLVTLPTLMWTLFPPQPRFQIKPIHFWRDTLFAVAPIAAITGLTLTFTYWITSVVYADQPVAVATMTVMTATFFGVYLVFLVGPMLGVTLNRVAIMARAVYLAVVVFVAVTSFGLGFMRDFFDFAKPNILILWPAIGVIVLAAIAQWKLANWAGKKFSNVNQSKSKTPKNRAAK